MPDTKPAYPKSKVVHTELRVELVTNSKTVKAILSAMSFESRNSGRCRMLLTASRDGRGLNMRFLSSDLTSLRAAMNTNLRLVATAIKAIEAVSKLSEKDSINKVAKESSDRQ